MVLCEHRSRGALLETHSEITVEIRAFYQRRDLSFPTRALGELKTQRSQAPSALFRLFLCEKQDLNAAVSKCSFCAQALAAAALRGCATEADAEGSDLQAKAQDAVPSLREEKEFLDEVLFLFAIS